MINCRSKPLVLFYKVDRLSRYKVRPEHENETAITNGSYLKKLNLIFILIARLDPLILLNCKNSRRKIVFVDYSAIKL